MLAALLCLLPALLLIAILMLRRYPGERRLLELAGAGRKATRRRQATTARGVARPRSQLPRGGLLIACSLAVRPPPPPALAT